MPRPAGGEYLVRAGNRLAAHLERDIPPLSVSRLSTALTPKYARFLRSSSTSGSRVWLRCVCVSITAGMTVLPARLTRVAPAGL